MARMADEIERILAFLVMQGQYERFLPRLRDSTGAHRDAALAEAPMSFFFHRNRFRIIRYDPPGFARGLGDLLIKWRETAPIFVEVKGPRWRAEVSPREWRILTDQQRKDIKSRLTEQKDQDLRARWIDPVGQALWVVEENALKKLLPDCPNLVVVVDDFFVTPIDIPNIAAVVAQAMRKPCYERLGGISS